MLHFLQKNHLISLDKVIFPQKINLSSRGKGQKAQIVIYKSCLKSTTNQMSVSYKVRFQKNKILLQESFRPIQHLNQLHRAQDPINQVLCQDKLGLFYRQKSLKKLKLEKNRQKFKLKIWIHKLRWKMSQKHSSSVNKKLKNLELKVQTIRINHNIRQKMQFLLKVFNKD